MIFDDVLKKLEGILKAEFGATPVYQSEVYEQHGTSAIRLDGIRTDLLEFFLVGEGRSYEISITYYLDAKPGKTRSQELRRVWERLNKVVMDNRTNSPYVWHDGRILEMVVNPERVEGEPELLKTGILQAIFSATRTGIA